MYALCGGCYQPAYQGHDRQQPRVCDNCGGMSTVIGRLLEEVDDE